MKRPVGVTILAVIHLAFAAFLLSLWVLAIRHPQSVVNSEILSNHLPRAYRVVDPLQLVLLPISGIISGVLEVGLWFLNRTARGTLMFFALIAFVRWPVGFLLTAMFRPKNLVFGFQPRVITTLAINGFILWYLSQDNVKHAFADPEPHYEDMDMIAEEAAREEDERE